MIQHQRGENHIFLEISKPSGWPTFAQNAIGPRCLFMMLLSPDYLLREQSRSPGKYSASTKCALQGPQSTAPATKSALQSPKILHLCRNLHFKVHQVFRLLRNLHFKVHKVLHVPRNLHFKMQKVPPPPIWGGVGASRATPCLGRRIN